MTRYPFRERIVQWAFEMIWCIGVSAELFSHLVVRLARELPSAFITKTSKLPSHLLLKLMALWSWFDCSLFLIPLVPERLRTALACLMRLMD
jgi:hypothetical protein